MRHFILCIVCGATILCACGQITNSHTQTIRTFPSVAKDQSSAIPTQASRTPGMPTVTVTTVPTLTQTPTPTPIPVAMHVFPVADAAVTYGAEHHDYPATDIFCDTGSSFVAVTDGIVDAIVPVDIWDPATDVPADRSGLAVALIGSDGVRYYGSHLSAIAAGLQVGQTVRSGQVLGMTGKSGNARFTPAHLHFGISRPSTPDDWEARRGQISPFPYLQAWQMGEVLIPSFE